VANQHPVQHPSLRGEMRQLFDTRQRERRVVRQFERFDPLAPYLAEKADDRAAIRMKSSLCAQAAHLR
jgi:hypothetical protein